MRLAIACDHAGLDLKRTLMAALPGETWQDLGTFESGPVDYPDLAVAVAEAIRRGEADLGILVCGTGAGMAIAANKVPGIRAAVAHDTFTARLAREHNAANVLALGARVIGSGLALEVVRTWLSATPQAGRHQRRVAKLSAIEERYRH
ncbi:MAG TPA: ribose 5-phosphate isomerase B [Bacillota bacterium]|nr:ribose 5-phosphate isomerase B [Bacillota bacterium]